MGLALGWKEIKEFIEGEGPRAPPRKIASLRRLRHYGAATISAIIIDWAK